MTEPEFVLRLPEPSLVVLIGATGSGKSTFAGLHFKPTEIVSSDRCRAMVADHEDVLNVNPEAFSIVHAIASARLSLYRLTVIDATNVQKEARAPLVELAHEHDLFAIAVVLDIPVEVCLERNRARPDRDIPDRVVKGHARQVRQSLRGLAREGFRAVHLLTPDRLANLRVVREPLWTNRRKERGPFDCIGDVHGCIDELEILLDRLGYVASPDGSRRHPEKRRAVFVGDLVDRGPDSVRVVELVRAMVREGSALCVLGNHDAKLARKLGGANVRVAHGLAETLEQIERLPPDSRDAFRSETRKFFESMVSHFVLEDGALVVAHAGMKERYQGRSSRRVREFALYGETTGEIDEFGLPVRLPWASDYRGRGLVVYGHTPVPTPMRENGTINIDTGCVFGGKLTALRWPEDELVSVPALKTYCEPAKPFLAEADGLSLSRDAGESELRLQDVAGKRVVATRLLGSVLLRAEQSGPALEVMSRFAVDPRRLIYLPPTMAPAATAKSGDWLERPEPAFEEYRDLGAGTVICQEKHMGSRALLVILREDCTVRARFGFAEPAAGIVYTRTGRPFFDDASVERDLLVRIRKAAEACGLWTELAADWMLLDAEIMPWSAKAMGLVRDQYSPTAAAGALALGETLNVLDRAIARGVELGDRRGSVADRAEAIARYERACMNYCRPTEGLAGLVVAPFHLLAAGDRAFFDRDHVWHMETIARLAAADPELIAPTPWLKVNTLDASECEAAVSWWIERTEAGMEGMVVKPLEFVTRGPDGLAQPALKVRGREYLRIIYGPEYALGANLDRLRGRFLGRKRGLALREFALGVEAVERFVRGEPLFRVHECVFGVLALKSEPVDPRL